MLSCGETFTSRARKRIFEAVVTDGTGTIHLKWFHFRKNWLKNQFAVGRLGLFCGELHYFSGVREIHHPEFEFINKNESLDDALSSNALEFGRILPVYPLTEGLTQKVFRKIFKAVVDNFAPRILTPIPAQILRRHGLVPLDRAFTMVHTPDNSAAMDELTAFSDPGRRSIVFDEFFFLELGLALRNRGVLQEPGMAFNVSHKYTKPLAKMLSFKLTEAQRRVLGEIKQDMMKPTPMNRLIQGDVGCGKTIVAMMASLVAIENDTQGRGSGRPPRSWPSSTICNFIGVSKNWA